MSNVTLIKWIYIQKDISTFCIRMSCVHVMIIIRVFFIDSISMYNTRTKCFTHYIYSYTVLTCNYKYSGYYNIADNTSSHIDRWLNHQSVEKHVAKVAGDKPLTNLY